MDKWEDYHGRRTKQRDITKTNIEENMTKWDQSETIKVLQTYSENREFWYK